MSKMKVIFNVLIYVILSVALHEEFDSLSFSVDENNCDADKTNEWDLVDYNSAGVELRSANFALRANTDSCLSVVNYAVVNGSVEIDVCLHLVSEKSGLDILVFNRFGALLSRDNFTILSEKYKPGWNTVKLPLVNYEGYVNIIGHSSGIEIILIDAIRYVIHTSKEDKIIDINLNDQIKHIVTHISNAEKDYDLIDDLLMIYDEPDDEEDMIEGSGTTEETPDLTTDVPSINEETGVWNTLTISLTAVGSFVAISAIAYGAFYFGKTRALANVNSFLEDFNDMESTVTIPRVRPTFR